MVVNHIPVVFVVCAGWKFLSCIRVGPAVFGKSWSRIRRRAVWLESSEHDRRLLVDEFWAAPREHGVLNMILPLDMITVLLCIFIVILRATSVIEFGVVLTFLTQLCSSQELRRTHLILANPEMFFSWVWDMGLWKLRQRLQGANPSGETIVLANWGW